MRRDKVIATANNEYESAIEWAIRADSPLAATTPRGDDEGSNPPKLRLLARDERARRYFEEVVQSLVGAKKQPIPVFEQGAQDIYIGGATQFFFSYKPYSKRQGQLRR
jgi:hypothetical protein